MDQIKEKIKGNIKNQEYTIALEDLNELLLSDSDNIDWLTFRGDIYNLKQEYGKALNDYNRVLKIESDNKIVRSKIEIIKDILKFQNLDIFESTNLNKDPWLDD